MRHLLKIDDQYLQNIVSGKKKAEIRLNDRDYQVGDTLSFYDVDCGGYREYLITHIHSGLGLQECYVVLSIEKTLNKPITYTGGGR